MRPLAGCTAVVAGAGVFGLATAVRLQAEGADVRLLDPAPVGDSASGVAAGMIAPALESELDPASRGHFGLLSRSRDLWPLFLARIGVGETLIDRAGALFFPATEQAGQTFRARLLALGAEVETVDPVESARLSPGLKATATGLFLPGEWRMSPQAGLRALSQVFVRSGGRIGSERLVLVDGGLAIEDGGPVDADVTVIASGAEAAALAGAAPALAHLEPIKGQILHFEGGPTAGPTIRTPRGYVTPQPGGAVVGATMELGLSDRRTDPVALERLRREAEALFPALGGVPARGFAGVRASTPDGLPLVGRASEGLVLATGARRNGWLLAPLVAELVYRAVAGEPPGEDGASLSPDRFDGP